MKAYLLSLIIAALVAALVGILAPSGERGGLAAHQRLITSLFLICVLIAPAENVLNVIQSLTTGDLSMIGLEEVPDKKDYQEQMNDALSASSERYFTQMLTQTICEAFSIPTHEINCSVSWNKSEGKPTRVTVILSGTSIWKDPHAIEAFVTELLGCECIMAIE